MGDVKGPTSYFPSIEARDGCTIGEWKAPMKASGLRTWKELMALLKEQHGMGPGHMNALDIDVLDDLKRG